MQRGFPAAMKRRFPAAHRSNPGPDLVDHVVLFRRRQHAAVQLEALQHIGGAAPDVFLAEEVPLRTALQKHNTGKKWGRVPVCLAMSQGGSRKVSLESCHDPSRALENGFCALPRSHNSMGICG